MRNMRFLRNSPRMDERAYVYAKACGIIGKSFIGKNLHMLSKAGGLSELDRLVFPAGSRNLPEKELLVDLEKRIIDREQKSIDSIVECFAKPPEFLKALTRRNQDAEPSVRTSQGLSDQDYYNALWKSLLLLPKRDRKVTEKILSDEISLRNCAWVLRLRTYYHMRDEEIITHLVNIAVRGKKKPGRTLADEALQCLHFPLDDFSAWSSWRWKEFLNTESIERHWHADPRHFQNAASRYLFHLARHHFHLAPFSLDTIFCFIKLKQFEEDVLTSSAEGLGMGLTVRDTVAMLGVG